MVLLEHTDIVEVDCDLGHPVDLESVVHAGGAHGGGQGSDEAGEFGQIAELVF